MNNIKNIIIIITLVSSQFNAVFAAGGGAGGAARPRQEQVVPRRNVAQQQRYTQQQQPLGRDFSDDIRVLNNFIGKTSTLRTANDFAIARQAYNNLAPAGIADNNVKQLRNRVYPLLLAHETQNMQEKNQIMALVNKVVRYFDVPANQRTVEAFEEAQEAFVNMAAVMREEFAEERARLGIAQ